MTISEARRAIVSYGAKLLFVAICCGMIGGGFAGLQSQSFNMPERVRALEVENMEDHMELVIVKAQYDALSEQVSNMHGIGIGVGTALGLLQIISMIASRKTKV